ncbi:MAG: hypothetical protein HY084_02585 [Gemmatimonadetes bacterium]|nr:hypothetical protein [Gemmatimonadota bacterium]
MRPRVALFALCLAATAAQARARWRVTSSPAADRWFTAMARLALPTPGALAYYEPAAAPPPWRARVARTPAFEVLHFVPLWYPSGTATDLTAAVRAAALDRAEPTPRAAFLVAALRRSIAPADRAALLRVAALVDSAEVPGVPATRLASLQAVWDSAYAPALAPYLASRRLDGGVLFVSPPLGAEGRIFEGVPADRHDNVLAVGVARGSAVDEAPLLAAVRETCAPLVTELAADHRVWRDDPAAAGRATVRCGAALLDRALPARSAAYRVLWAWHAGARRYTDAFPPNAAEDAAIDAALRRAFAAHDVR